jgi:hypothetical protein
MILDLYSQSKRRHHQAATSYSNDACIDIKADGMKISSPMEQHLSAPSLSFRQVTSMLRSHFVNRGLKNIATRPASHYAILGISESDPLSEPCCK